MSERFCSATDPESRYWLASTCGLAPRALDDLQVPLAHAHQLVENSPDRADYLTCLGLLLYRTGHFDEAANRLLEANDALAKQPSETTTAIYPTLLLAMPHGRLGHPDEAQQWLAKGKAAIEKEQGTPCLGTVARPLSCYALRPRV